MTEPCNISGTMHDWQPVGFSTSETLLEGRAPGGVSRPPGEGARYWALAAALVLLVGVGGCDRGGEVVEPTGAEASAPARDGKRADERYRTGVAPESLEVDREQGLELQLLPGEGLEINEEFPNWRLELQPPEGVRLGARSFSSDQFELERDRARIETTILARRSGSYEIPGAAEFSVCNDETCHVLRDEAVSFRVRIASSDDSSSER